MNGLALCAGYGGLELGIRLAEPTYRTVCYVEREAYAAALLRSRMADGTLDEAPIWSDLGTFDGKPWRGVVDCITAGFPCQPWSLAGQRKGTEDERWLWLYIDRTVRDVRPQYLFVENVPGLLLGGIEHVCGTLADLGFDAEWDVFTASEVGAPHIRKRLFLLAHSNGTGHEFQWGGGLPQSRPPCGYNADGCSSDVAHPRLSGRGSSPGPQPPGQGSDRPGECGQDLGDTDSEGLAQRQGAGSFPSPSSLAFPDAFPPGPADSWDEVPEEFEPAICRMAYGPSNRVDRLRACGNGVVPDVAAVAFSALWERIHCA